MNNAFIRLFYLLIVRPWLTYIIGVNFQNREIFKDIDQFIVVANHNSHFDMVAILAALPGNKLKDTKAVAAADYFGKSSLARNTMNFFFNSILINRKRDGTEVSPIEILDKNLKDGNSLVLFPEGSRGKPGVIKDFKKGVAILLKNNSSIPFIPVYLDGFGRVLPKDHTLIIPMVCKVRFGKPVFVDDKNNIEDILQRVKDEIFELNNKDERDRNKFDYE